MFCSHGMSPWGGYMGPFCTIFTLLVIYNYLKIKSLKRSSISLKTKTKQNSQVISALGVQDVLLESKVAGGRAGCKHGRYPTERSTHAQSIVRLPAAKMLMLLLDGRFPLRRVLFGM